VFTKDNTIDSTPEQLASLNAELSQRLHGIDPNDYSARQKIEVEFRAEVHDRPRTPQKPAEPVGLSLIEHAEREQQELGVAHGQDEEISKAAEAEREAAASEHEREERAKREQAETDRRAADERAEADRAAAQHEAQERQAAAAQTKPPG
jgi:hypothetical protein